VVAENIKRLESGNLNLRRYIPEAKRMCVMMGRNDAMVIHKESVRTGASWAYKKQKISLSGNSI
jgi:hypothetical protein